MLKIASIFPSSFFYVWLLFSVSRCLAQSFIVVVVALMKHVKIYTYGIVTCNTFSNGWAKFLCYKCCFPDFLQLQRSSLPISLICYIYALICCAIFLGSFKL